MDKEHVLRVPREDGADDNDFVLVNVREPRSDGGELVVEGTEGEIPYVGNCE